MSAFSPICNPINCPWGKKAFSGYLGSDEKSWEDYDATVLIRKMQNRSWDSEILIDQGKSDDFLAKGQLLPENFIEAAKSVNAPLRYRLHENYDHSYYFISSFIDDHIQHHSSYLLNSK